MALCPVPAGPLLDFRGGVLDLSPASLTADLAWSDCPGIRALIARDLPRYLCRLAFKVFCLVRRIVGCVVQLENDDDLEAFTAEFAEPPAEV